MGVFIKNAEVEAKIRRLAAQTGETLTEAIERSVDQRLSQIEPLKRPGRVDRKSLAALLDYFDSLPVDDARTPDEIIGYDERGVPR